MEPVSKWNKSFSHKIRSLGVIRSLAVSHELSILVQKSNVNSVTANSIFATLKKVPYVNELVS